MQHLARLFAPALDCLDAETFRLEEWPEGIVLFVGSEIRWRSWLDGDFAEYHVDSKAKPGR